MQRLAPLYDRPAALLIFLWGAGGVLGILVNAIIRLTPIALQPLRDGLSPALTAVYLLWALWMAYTEGYRGFHRAFAPRVAARALALADRPRPALVVLAPLVAMGLLHATRKRAIISWSVVVGVTGLVLLVRNLEQPWRGIIDGGVVLGLSLGALSVLYFLIAALRGRPPAIAADFPARGEGP
jgi:hypothetical protein